MNFWDQWPEWLERCRGGIIYLAVELGLTVVLGLVLLIVWYAK